ncbi:MAG: hypothetical protein HCAMLNBO_01393 [Candidatus Brocadia fulgida]|nr:hypothetical protein [Candidatus Brocadia fulgida]
MKDSAGVRTVPVDAIAFLQDNVAWNRVSFCIQDGKILSCESRNDPAQFFVTPGFVNCHMHWLMLGEPTLEREIELMKNRPDEMIDIMVENARSTVLKGITACCDKGPPGLETHRIYQGLRTAKSCGLPVPKTLVSTWTISVDGAFASPLSRRVYSQNELEQVIRELHETGAGIMKIIPESGLRLAQFTYDWVFPEAYFAVAREMTARLGLILAIHAKGPESIGMGLKYSVDCIEHATEASVTQLKEMQGKGIYLSPTLEGLWCRLNYATSAGSGVATAAFEWGNATQMFRNAVVLNDGKPFTHFLFGSDAGSASTPHASLRELYLMRKLGLPAEDCLRAAMVNGARFMRLHGSIGQLTPGYCADMIFWRRNPLELDVADWEHLDQYIAAVMLDGNLIEP